MSRAPKQPPKQPTGAAPQHTQGTRDAAGTHAPAPPAAPLERMGTLTLGPVFTLPLDQIALAPEVYRHRPEKALASKNNALKELADNLIVEGQRDPLVVFKDEHPADPAKPYVLVAGHRRHAALHLLADKNTPGFTRDMQVTARALEGGSKVDYLLLSVSDNLFHEPLDSRHLTLAAVELLKAGCPHTRIKVNLRLSDSTFARCVRLYESQWMLKHVGDDNLSLTDVHMLLEAAGGQGGAEALEYLKQDLGVVFAEVRGQIDEKADEAAERGKELKGPATKVKNYLPKHLIKSWVQALKQGKRVQSQAKYKYGAAVVQEKTGKRVQIPAISLPVVDGELDKLLEVTTKLDRLVKQLRPQLLMLAQARVINADAVDGDGVRDAGLGEIFEILDSLKRRGVGSRARKPEADWQLDDMEAKERELTDPLAGVQVNDHLCDHTHDHTETQITQDLSGPRPGDPDTARLLDKLQNGPRRDATGGTDGDEDGDSEDETQ